MITTRRIYEGPSADDGQRVLTERLWPRGVSKISAAIDWWPRDIAPSPELRVWYSHEVSKWPEFQRRYRQELEEKQELIEELLEKARSGPLTLVYASKDVVHNSTVFLAGYLGDRLDSGSDSEPRS